MKYLVLAFCSSALISIMMRLGEERIRNNVSLLSTNYLVCLLLSLAFSAGSGSIIVPADTGMPAIMLGMISGVFYFGSFLLYQINIQKWSDSVCCIHEAWGADACDDSSSDLR